MEGWPEKKSPSLDKEIQRFEWNSQKTIYRRVRNSGKETYLLTKANIMYLEEMDIIMCGENPGKNFLLPVKYVGGSVTVWGCMESS